MTYDARFYLTTMLSCGWNLANPSSVFFHLCNLRKVYFFSNMQFFNQREAKPNLLRSWFSAQAWNELSKKKKTDWKPKDHEHFGKLSLWVSPREIIKQRKIQRLFLPKYCTYSTVSASVLVSGHAYDHACIPSGNRDVRTHRGICGSWCKEDDKKKPVYPSV